MGAANTSKVALAFLAAPASAVVALGLLVFALLPLGGYDPNPPSQVAFHFALFGAIIIFPISIAVGVPLYLLFVLKGWLTRRAVFIGGLGLSLAYPIFVTLQNPQSPSLVTLAQYVICAVCGLVAAWVFCKVSGLSSRQSCGAAKP